MKNLIECPQCHKMLSVSATSCPRCGRLMKDPASLVFDAEQDPADNAEKRNDPTGSEGSRLSDIYNDAVKAMESAETEEEYKAAAEAFGSIPGFRDDELVGKCLEKAEECRRDAIYNDAVSKMAGDNAADYEAAEGLFKTIPGWKDADEKGEECRKRIGDIKEKEEAARLEAERREAVRLEAERLEAERREAERLEAERKESVYGGAVEALKNARTADEFLAAAETFKTIPGYKAADRLVEVCGKKAAEIKEKEAAEKLEAERREAERLEAERKEAERLRSVYDKAVTMVHAAKTAEDYGAAGDLFGTIPGYRDADELRAGCRKKTEEIIAKAEEIRLDTERREAEAAEAAKNAQKKAAVKKYGIIGTSVLAIVIIAAVVIALVSSRDRPKASVPSQSAKVGDYIQFGSYEQDNELSNGKEPIEWLVLDKQEGKALVISRYALDCQQYNTEWVDVTWENCSLRRWLNNDFLNEAFGAEEQARVVHSTVKADKNPDYDTVPGNDTTDNVFLLSISEVNRYFGSDVERMCVPTAYAEVRGAWTSEINTVGGEAACWWWLRSPGSDSISAADVFLDGDVDEDGIYVGNSDSGVRPALWIDLDDRTAKTASVTQPNTTAATQPKTTATQPQTTATPAFQDFDKIIFGSYEQDNDTTNGREPIEWLILDKRDGKALVISKYALDCQPYNTEWVDVTREICSLR